MGLLGFVLKRIVGLISGEELDDGFDDIDDIDDIDDDVDGIDDADDGFDEIDSDIEELEETDDSVDVIDDYLISEEVSEAIDANELLEPSEWVKELMETQDTKKISFTGLLDRGLERSDAYQSWTDGVSPFEIAPKDISEVASHIAEEFSQTIPEIKHDWFSGGFATVTAGNGTIYYDGVAIIKDSMGGYGASNIIGSVAHEMGHNIVDRVFSDSGVSRLEHEIGADYLEGVVYGMTGVDPTEKFAWLKLNSGDTINYLPANGRVNVINEGVQWGRSLRLAKMHAPDTCIDVGSNEVLSDKLKSIMDKYNRK